MNSKQSSARAFQLNMYIVKKSNHKVLMQVMRLR